MATYRMIQEHVKAEAGFVPKTCWIGEVKASYCLTRRDAPNGVDPDRRNNPCPADKHAAIEAALRHFRLL